MMNRAIFPMHPTEHSSSWIHGFLTMLKPLFAVIMLMMVSLPALSKDWDWRDHYVWQDTTFNVQTHTYTWSIKLYDHEGYDEGFLNGNRLKIYVTRGGDEEVLVGEAWCADTKDETNPDNAGKGAQFIPTTAGRKMGFKEVTGQHTSVPMVWVMPLHFFNRRVQIRFEGDWKEVGYNNKTHVNVLHTVSKNINFLLSTPKISDKKRPKLYVTGVDKGKATSWEYHFPFTIEAVPKDDRPKNYIFVDNRDGDDRATLNAQVSTLNPSGSYQEYRRDSIGNCVNTYCTITEATKDNDYNISVKTNTEFVFKVSDIYDSDSQKEPNILRNGMSLLLRNTYWAKPANAVKAEFIHSVPTATDYKNNGLNIPASPYPENLTATFITRSEDATAKDTARYVRLSWVAHSEKVSGRWRIFSYTTGAEDQTATLVSSEEPLDTVPMRDTTYVYDIKVTESLLANPKITYVVAWEPAELDTSSVKIFRYFQELANQKEIDISRYISITDAKCDSYDQYMQFTWTAKTNATNWNGNCELWTEDGKLKTVKPKSSNNGVYHYEFYHLSSIGELPDDIDKDYFERSSLTQCTPHNYEIRANYDNSSGQYTRAIFNHRAIDVGIGFRTVDVSRGVYSDKVRITATTNNPDGIKLQYTIKRKLYTEKASASNDDDFTDMYTQDNGSATISWEDYSVEPGHYYIYKVIASYQCDNKKTVAIEEEMVGFCQNTGVISGKISYNGGTASQDVDLRLILNDGDSINSNRNMLHSMELADGGHIQWTVPDKQYANHINEGDLTAQFWVSPIGDYNANRDNTLFHFGNIKVSHDAKGLKINDTLVQNSRPLTPNQWTHITLTYNRKKATYSVIEYFPVSYNGEYPVVTDSIVSSLRADITGAKPLSVNRGDVLYLGGLQGLYDDFRLYSRQLTAREQCDTYDRHLHGEENGLDIYWTFNEGISRYAFDTSRSGSQLNGRHGIVENGKIDNNTNVFPNLGFRTRTDAFGNYVLRGIPFDGRNGINYLLQPSYPNHTFSPESRQHIVSTGSLVYNASDFEDTSSFPFYGNVTYLYGDIPSEGIEIRVDGMQQTGENGMLTTDRYGNFRVDVPIGEHYIELKRDGHVLQNRWPAAPGSKYNFVSAKGLGTEAAPIHFTDSTLTLVAGRVVGGDIQDSIPLGGGLSKANIGRGTITLKLSSVGNYNINTSDKPVDVAYREFADSLQQSTDCEAFLLPKSGKVRIRTNPLTGEYYAKLPPVAFAVDSVSTREFYSHGLREDFGSTASYAFTPLPTDTITNIRQTAGNMSASATGSTESQPDFVCNYRMNFVRHNSPVYQFIDVTTRDSLRNYHPEISEQTRTLYFGDTKYDTGNGNMITLVKPVTSANINPQKKEDMAQLYNTGYPIYDKAVHEFDLSAFEVYRNLDADEVVVDSVPLAGRSIEIVNGLGCTKYKKDDPTPEVPIETISIGSDGHSGFYILPGVPNLTPPYLLNLTLSDQKTGNEFFNLPLYVFGSKKIEGSTFVTEGPDELDYVIHDPYGTNSSAWLESGSTYSTTKTTTYLADEYYYSDYGGIDFLGTEKTWFANGGISLLNKISGSTVADFVDGKGLESFLHIRIDGGETEQKIWTNGIDVQTVTTNEERISTSDSPDYVGPPADVFVGDGTNYLISDSRKLGLWSKSGETPKTFEDVELDVRNAITVAKDGEKTRFHYTRHHIMNELIPEYKRLRRNLFREPQDPDNYGTYTLLDGVDIDDPNLDWSDVNKIYSWKAKEGTSQTDMASTWTSHISVWETHLRNDEIAQAACHQSVSQEPVNRSLNNGVTYSESYSGKIGKTEGKFDQVYKNRTMAFDFLFKIHFEPSKSTGIDLQFNAHTKSSEWSMYANKDDVTITNDTWASNVNWGYELKESVIGNYTSQDIYTTIQPDIEVTYKKDGNTKKETVNLIDGSPIFVLRGGQTRSPWERALHMKYFDMGDPGNPDNVIGSDTQPICIPSISFPNEVYDHAIEMSHLRAGHPVTIPLKLESLSPQTFRGIDYILTAYANGDASALNMKVDGQSIVGVERLYRLATGEPLTTPLVVSQVRPDKYDYDTYIYLLAHGQSAYDSPMGYIADSVHVVLHFDPTSSDVSITPGASVLNNSSEGKLQLRVADYDRNLDHFCCIDLMYRRPDEGEFNHTFARYWVNADTMKVYEGKNVIPVRGKEYQNALVLPDSPQFVHDFDMSSMYDGEYYITAVARSYYPDGAGGSTAAFLAEYQCDPVHIRKDMTRPELLDRPTPVNGRLTIHDQVCATFTEDINTDRLQKYRNVNAYLVDGENLTPLDLDMSADERHIYINIDRVRRQAHGRYVRFVLKDVEDLAGNAMADSVAWEVLADFSTLTWTNKVVNITASVSQLPTLSFTETLLNNSETSQNCSFAVPEWLKERRTDIVRALSTAPVEFYVTRTLPIGKHKGYVRVYTDNSEDINTDLEVNITVIGDGPDISVNTAKYPNTMNLIATMEAPEGMFCNPGRDQVYAYADDDCVGKSSIVAKDGKLMVYMDIYGTDMMNYLKSPIRFAAWDAGTDTFYGNVGSSQRVVYTNNSIVGSVTSPVVLTVSENERSQYIPLKEGWTWASFNITTDSLFAALVKPIAQTTDISIKNTTLALRAYKNNITGLLAGMQPDVTSMYACWVDHDAELDIVGSVIDPARYPITLTPQWTWIGYTAKSYNDINSALANLKATDNDLIKSQDAFAIYREADGTWYGNLETLYPGQGYKYYSQSADNVQFCYTQPATVANTKTRTQKSQPHWTTNTHYADNMTVLGRVVNDGEVVTHGEIGCFVGTECRGYGVIDAEGYAYFVVQGTTNGERVQCYYWNNETQTVHPLTPSLFYQKDANMGSFASPVELLLDTATGISVITDADGDYDYYTLEGLRVNSQDLHHGSIYIRTNGVVREKILKK